MSPLVRNSTKLNSDIIWTQKSEIFESFKWYNRALWGYSPFLRLKSKGLASSFSYYFLWYRRLPEDQANLEEKSELHATTSPDSIQRASEQTLSPKTVKISVLTERFLLLSMLFQDWFSFVDRIATPGFPDGPPTQYRWKETPTPDPDVNEAPMSRSSLEWGPDRQFIYSLPTQ